MNPQNGYALGVRQFWREWSAGRMRMLFASVALAVLGVGTVAMVADRVRSALLQQAAQLLGGDLVLRSDHAIDAAVIISSVDKNIQVARTAEFPTTIRTVGLDGKARFKLVELKAVTPNFPLRGAYVLQNSTPELGNLERLEKQGPKRGEVWVALRMFRELQLSVGAAIKLGAQSFKISGVIIREPDAALDYSAIAPRVLIHADDLAATALEQPGARIIYRLVFAGAAAQIESLEAELKSNIDLGQRIETVRDARPELRVGLDRAQRFLGLALLAALTLSATALALAAWRFANQQIDVFAVMRTLGATRRTLMQIVLTQLSLLGIFASITGLVIAELASRALGWWLQQQLAVVLPSSGVLPWLQGVGIALLMLFGFAAPQLFRLRQVPAMRVISRQFDAPDANTKLLFFLGFIALIAVGTVLAGDAKTASFALGGLVGAMALLAVAAFALIAVIKQLRPYLSVQAALGLAGVIRRGRLNVLSIVAIGLSVTALMLLTLIRTDLLVQWRVVSAADCPPSAVASSQAPSSQAPSAKTPDVVEKASACATPNRFLINVQDAQRLSLASAFAQNKLGAIELWPMLRGRYTLRNGQKFQPPADQARARRMAEREFNLSVAQLGLPDGNQIVAGKFFDANSTQPELSVEVDLAELLGWQLGDRIQFDLGGILVEAPITSLRTVKWDNFRPNFFVLLNDAAWQNLPASWIASFRISNAQLDQFDRVMVDYPNVSVIDLEFVQRQVRDVITQVSRAIELVFWFTLVSGVLVLIGAISATQNDRRYDASLMRVLGAKSQQLRQFDAVEFAIVGVIAGTIACVCATVMTVLIAKNVFGFEYAPNWSLVSLGVLGTTFIVMLIGLFGTRNARASSPLNTLRAGLES